MKFRGGEFSTGTTRNFQSELTLKMDFRKKLGFKSPPLRQTFYESIQ